MFNQNQITMKRLMLFFGFLALMIVPVFSQEIPPPTDFVSVLMGLTLYLGSLPGAVALLFFLVPAVLGMMNIQGKFLKYFFTTLIVAGVVVIAWFVPFGYLKDTFWWTIPVNVASIMLVQIGFFAIDFIENIQDKIYDKFNPWKPKE